MVIVKEVCMKKILLCILMVLMFGCQKEEVIQEEEIQLKLNQKRIQIGINEKIDYLSYVDSHIADVKYNIIDTSKVGCYQITYEYKNQKEKLIVDVVKKFENNIYSPLNIEVQTVDNPDDITVFINKIYVIPQDYVPNDLVDVVDSHFQLRKEAALAYKEFYNEAKNRNISIYTISAYRTYETQKLYWDNQVKVNGEEYASKYSAYPLRSEHELGLSLDVSYKLTGDRLSESVADSDIGKFIVSDGYKYGFILRYPKDKEAITNYGYEPWHIRYVGKELAKKLHDENITLDEYYQTMEN
jgi:D-alanyl-D-alanine carboxypeptidase